MTLLKEVANEYFTLMQLKNNEVKMQANTTEIYSKLVLAHGEENTNIHTYQLKKNRSYKVVLRGMHPKTDINEIIDTLKKSNHKLRQLNIAKCDTR